MHADTLGLLAAAVALALYPGGLFLAAGGWMAASAGRLGAAGGGAAAWTAPQLVAPFLLTAAAALLPLAGSPAATLPADQGAPSSLLGLLLLLAAAFAPATPAAGRGRRALAAAAAGLPLVVLAAAAASFALPVVLSLPGARLTAARALAAAALALAAPVLAGLTDEATPPLLRGLRAASLALLAGALLPAPVGGSALGPVAGLLIALALGGAARPMARAPSLAGWLLTGLAATAGAASVVLTALELRG